MQELLQEVVADGRLKASTIPEESDAYFIVEPVYAVVDEGSLTTEDFRYAVTVTPEQAEADGELVFPCLLYTSPSCAQGRST